MTIKRKLFSLVFGELFMFLLVIAIAIISFLPILKINSEFSKLSTLAEQVLVMQVKVNSLLYAPLEGTIEKVIEQAEVVEEEFDEFARIEELTKISDRVATAIKAVEGLEQLYTQRLDVLITQMPDVLEDMEKILFSTNLPAIRLYKTDNVDRYGEGDIILGHVQEMERNISITDSALNSAYEVISVQYSVIQTELSVKIFSLIIRTLIIFIVMIAIIILFSIRTASGMGRSIHELESGVSRLRKGKLLTDFDTSSKDEIGELGDNLNHFASDLSSSILKIKTLIGNTLQMKDELLNAAEDSNSSSDAITDAVSTIRKGMVDLDGRVAESGTSVDTVKTRTDELKGMLEEQMAMIEESTSSVTEMIASIRNVSEITTKKKAATDTLVQTAGTGGERLDETIRIIQEITANVDEIRGTASIIQSVAAQTSLLAMNAAIEAAHAGEYGAGFSVVAEEIRKLADASGTSSKRIGGVLKEVITSIEQAAVSGDDTKRAFSDINTEVRDVAGALDEISSSMDELAAGGRQILDAMTSLQGYAVNVQESGGTMSDAAGSLEDAFRTVERVTGSVLSHISGIGSRIDEISGAVGVVSRISSRLSSESEQLESEVARYRTEDSE